MYVTAEEFLEMLHEIRERYRNSHLNLDDPEVMHAILLREYPEVEGVIPPPSYETFRERYIPEEWRMLIPESRRGAPAISEIRPGEEGSLTDPVAEWCRQVMADLDTLTGDTIAGMTYAVDRSLGMDSRSAMDRARATGQLFQIVALANRRAYYQAVSGSSGQPRDTHTTRAEQVAQQEMSSRARAAGRQISTGMRDRPRRDTTPLRPVSAAVRPGYPARAPMTIRVAPTTSRTGPGVTPTLSIRTRPPAPPATSASPARTRERLRRMAGQSGSPGSPRRR